LKKALVSLILSFLFPLVLASAQTSYTSKNPLSPLIISVKTDSNLVTESITCLSMVRLTSINAPIQKFFFPSVSPNAVNVGGKVNITLSLYPQYVQYADVLNVSELRPLVSVFLQEENRWILTRAEMVRVGNYSFMYEYIPSKNGTYDVYIEFDSGTFYLTNAFVVGSAGGAPSAVNYWLVGLFLLGVFLAVMLLARRSSSYIRYIGGYRYFAVLFHIFKRNVFYVVDLINGRW